MTDTQLQKVDAKELRTRPLSDPAWIRTMMDYPDIVAQIGRCFPGEINGDRRTTKTRALLEQVHIHIVNSKACQNIVRCTNDSIIQSITEMASLGLSPTKASGECYLVPYKAVCTCMVGYRGFIKLVVNTGAVSSVTSTLIYEGEEFTPWHDENGAHWRHEPQITLQGQDAKIVGAYAVFWIINGPPVLEMMNLAQLKKVQAVSRAKGGPYSQWLGEMYRKAPIRRGGKRIPMTGDPLAVQQLTQAIGIDNKQYTVEDVDRHQKMLTDHSRGMVDAEDQPLADAPTEEPEYAEDGQRLPDDLPATAERNPT